jgi:hypothetical protein
MNKPYRTYTEEFKLEALDLMKTSGKSAAQIEQGLGIMEGLLVKWCDHPQMKPANGDTSWCPVTCRGPAGDPAVAASVSGDRTGMGYPKEAVSIFSQREQ